MLYEEIYIKAKAKIATRMRIEKIYKYLLSCKNEKLIYEIENIINERREI